MIKIDTDGEKDKQEERQRQDREGMVQGGKIVREQQRRVVQKQTRGQRGSHGSGIIPATIKNSPLDGASEGPEGWGSICPDLG